MNRLQRLIIPLVIVALVGAAAFVMFRGEERKQLTAEFPRTVSLYEGSDVRVLGVSIGQVDRVEPAGEVVEVTMSYDPEVDIPRNASAVIIAPSVVGDRFVQLTPAYTKGAVLADGAHLDVSRTSTPLELDEIYSSVDQLSRALGPDRANSDGALNDLLEVTADNFDGQGAKVNRTIRDLGTFTGTLDNNKEELFGTAAQLQRFVGKLARNDRTVRRFNRSMSSVSKLLAGERKDLARSLKHLGVALGEVKGFVRDNKTLLSRNIKGLNKVSKVLVKRRKELAETLNTAPLALNNLALTYNPNSGTLDVSANLERTPTDLLNDPGLFLCTVVGPNDPSGKLCGVIQQIFGRPGALSRNNPVDPTLGALLEVTR